MQKIIVIGGGKSAGEVDFSKISGFKIGSNESCVLTPCNIGLTMDRLWFENRIEKIKDTCFYARKAAVKKCKITWPNLTIFDCNYESDEFSEDASVLNGRNSGFCAFNLAYLLAKRDKAEIYLIGFDMQGGYWYPPYPWATPKPKKPQPWVSGFETARKICDAAGIKVTVVGNSLIESFPKITIQQFKEICK